MTGAPERVPALGGTRTVPTPDPIARDYLLLALRLDQHAPGLVDGYFGPADLKARVDIDPLPGPARLRDDARALAERIATEPLEPDRRAWLAAQVAALEAQAAALAGDGLPYVEHVTRCLGATPRAPDEATLDAAAAQAAALLPDTLLPGAPLGDRLAAWDAALEVPPDRLPEIVEPLVGRLRARSAELFGLPDGEGLRTSYVRGQAWSGYCWYDGGLRSRIDLDLSVPTRLPEIALTLAHETYPGHHLEHAWKEATLVEGAGRLEASALLLDTPECLVSEGLAELGREFALPPVERAGLVAELAERAGLPVAADPGALRDVAERAAALVPPRQVLAASRVGAALLRHAEGADHETVLGYLREVGRYGPVAAERRLAFIDHPRWRTYVVAYTAGEALVRRWVEAAPPDGRVERFGRLLREQLPPGALAAGAA